MHFVLSQSANSGIVINSFLNVKKIGGGTNPSYASMHQNRFDAEGSSIHIKNDVATGYILGSGRCRV